MLWPAALLTVAMGAACSDDGGGGAVPASYDTGASADAADDASDAADGVGPADGNLSDGNGDGNGDGDGEDGASADSAASDTITAADTDIGGDGEADTAFPDGFLEPLEDADGAGDAVGSDAAADGEDPTPGPVGELYAHTGSELYRLDPATLKLKLVGSFTFDKEKADVNDIALDRDGVMYACTKAGLFVCDRLKASCKYAAKLAVSYNGLTFVADKALNPTEDTLVGMGADGSWNRITIEGGATKIKKLGEVGSGWVVSGDAFSIVGVGTFATLKGKSDTDVLAVVNPATGALVKIVGDTGIKGLFGLAWWGGAIYAFGKDGGVFVLDPASGKASPATSLQAPAGKAWYGAGVSTRAAGG